MAKLPPGVKPLTREAISRYAKGDVAGFLSEQYVPPETRRAIKLERWQKEYILDPLYTTMCADDTSKRQYNIALLGMPKKNGKSSLAAGIGVYETLCGDLAGEVIVAANDKDQASMIIYNKMRQSIGLNPNLKKAVLRTKAQLEVPSTGTIARCVAHSYETAAGLNPSCTIFDELWGFNDRRFYDELTVVPTRKNPLIVIVTYAGYAREGLLWDLYCDGMAGDDIIDTGDPEVVIKQGARDKNMFFFWSNRNLASWVTEEYLDGQRNRLPTQVFQRLHENKWVDAADRFITDADIDHLFGFGWVPQYAPQPTHRYIVSTDLGISADRTCRCVGHYDRSDGKVYVDNLRLWEGTKESHVDISEVEADIESSCKSFNTPHFVVDPWQMESTIQRLRGKYHVIPFSPQADTYRLSQVLVNLMLTGRLVCYQYPPLVEELKRTIVKQTQRGWRIDHDSTTVKGKRAHNDILTAIGMMCLEAIREEFGPNAAEDFLAEENLVLAEDIKGGLIQKF